MHMYVNMYMYMYMYMYIATAPRPVAVLYVDSPAAAGAGGVTGVLAAREHFKDLARKVPAVVCAVMEVDGALEALAKKGVRFSQVPCVPGSIYVYVHSCMCIYLYR